jgi:glycosyltransferase involved in cell wall biosynthesis
LDSIPNREDIQIIVVDDNSDNDKRPQISKPNLEIVYLSKEESKGAGRARNIGLTKAAGEWLLFADADDFFTSDAFITIDSFVVSDADMILFKAISFNSETLVPANRNERINGLVDLYFENKITAREVVLSVQVPWSRMIKRSLITANNFKFDEIMCSNDTMFTTKVGCTAKKILISSEIIYAITFREGSLWTSRYINSENYLTRLETQIRRNQYVSCFGHAKTPILGLVVGALKVNLKTFFRALCIVLKNRAIFHGFSQYVRF